MKKNKKVLLIVAVLAVVIGWFLWNRNAETETVASGSIVATKTPAEIERDAMVAESMAYIKGNPEWSAEISRKSVINGRTYNQQLADDAINSLKGQGRLPSGFNFIAANW
jgi:hypothetical protein